MASPFAAPWEYPCNAVEQLLSTRTLTRKSYLNNRRRWMAWLDATKQDRLPISTTTTEEELMEFTDYKLSEAETEAAALWHSEIDAEFMILVNEIVADGYRIAATEDLKNHCIVITIIGKDKSCVNFDRAMSTRHSSVANALHLAVYKHVVIFKSDTWGESTGESMYG